MKINKESFYSVNYADEKSHLALSHSTSAEICELVSGFAGASIVRTMLSQCDRDGEAKFKNPVGHLDIVLYKAAG